MLKQYSVRLFNTYKDRVLYNPTIKCFFYNGIFIKTVGILNDTLTISFNDPEQRVKNAERNNVDLKISIEVAYKRADGSILAMENGYCNLDYFNVRSCTMKLKDMRQYDVARVKVQLNDAFMYENEIVIKDMLF